MRNPKHDLILKLVHRELRKIYYKWESISRVDCGGCGYMAKFIFDGFESLGYKPQIRALLPKWEVFECGNQLNVIQDLIISKDNSVIKNNKDLCDNGLAATHYMLKWNDNYIDLSGCYKSLSDTIDWKYLTDVAYITPDILTRISSSEVGWNTAFRIEYLDNIKEDIEKAFVKINGILENQKRYQRLILFQESVLLSA
jgi:hypothetical protein